jgi:hypothetical protein
MINRKRPATVLVVAAIAALAACQSEQAPETTPDAVVTVNGGSVLRSLEPGLIFGANFGAWVLDTKLVTSTRDLVKALRPSVGRFPGGNMANDFCWVTQKVSGNDHLVWEDWNWGIDVAEYLAFAKAVGAVPMFSLNPFDHVIDGQPHSAAARTKAPGTRCSASTIIPTGSFCWPGPSRPSTQRPNAWGPSFHPST